MRIGGTCHREISECPFNMPEYKYVTHIYFRSGIFLLKKMWSMFFRDFWQESDLVKGRHIPVWPDTLYMRVSPETIIPSASAVYWLIIITHPGPLACFVDLWPLMTSCKHNIPASRQMRTYCVIYWRFKVSKLLEWDACLSHLLQHLQSACLRLYTGWKRSGLFICFHWKSRNR